jgi:hypothetical protein
MLLEDEQSDRSTRVPEINTSRDQHDMVKSQETVSLLEKINDRLHMRKEVMTPSTTQGTKQANRSVFSNNYVAKDDGKLSEVLNMETALGSQYGSRATSGLCTVHSKVRQARFPWESRKDSQSSHYKNLVDKL